MGQVGMEGRTVDAVLFDAGNTLIYMPKPPEEILRDLCAELGHHVGAEEARQAYARSERFYTRHRMEISDEGEFWLRFHGEALLELGIEDSTGEKAAYLSHGFGRAGVWQAYPEAAEVCRHLRTLGIRLAVVSNGPASVANLISQAGLMPFFETIVASQTLGVEKPDPRIFLEALARLGVDPGRALFVGDLYEVDVRGALGAGLHAVLVDRNGRSGRVDCPVIGNLAELIPLLELGAF